MYKNPYSPMAIGLVYGDTQELVLTEGVSYLSLSNETIFSAVQKNLVDLMVVADSDSQPTSGCTVFDRLYPNWGNLDYVLSGSNEKLLSLNHCVPSTLKFLPRAYKIGRASPGVANDCQYKHDDVNDRGIETEIHLDRVSPTTNPNPIPILVPSAGETAGEENDPENDPLRDLIENEDIANILDLSSDVRAQFALHSSDSLGANEDIGEL